MKAELTRLKNQIPEPPFHKLCKEDSIDKIGIMIDQHPELLNLQDQKHGLTFIANAVIYSKLEIVRYLLNKGADPNIKDFVGESPLHLAADNSDTDIAEALLL